MSNTSRFEVDGTTIYLEATYEEELARREALRLLNRQALLQARAEKERKSAAQLRRELIRVNEPVKLQCNLRHSSEAIIVLEDLVLLVARIVADHAGSACQQVTA